MIPFAIGVVALALAIGLRFCAWFGLPVAFDASFPTAMVPAGTLISSAEDMSHYLSMYLGGGSYRGHEVLSAAGIAEMERPAPKTGSAHYAMGWAVGTLGGVKVIWHSGDFPNFHTAMYLGSDGNWGAIVLENINGGNPVAAAQISGPEESVVKLVAGAHPGTQSATELGYVTFDLVVVVIIGVQLWTPVRVLRRRDRRGIPMSRLSRLLGQRRLRLLPLLWEVGVPAAIGFGIPLQAEAAWRVVWLSLLI